LFSFDRFRRFLQNLDRSLRLVRFGAFLTALYLSLKLGWFGVFFRNLYLSLMLAWFRGFFGNLYLSLKLGSFRGFRSHLLGLFLQATQSVLNDGVTRLCAEKRRSEPVNSGDHEANTGKDED
jgi:hypothetical protein